MAQIPPGNQVALLSWQGLFSAQGGGGADVYANRVEVGPSNLNERGADKEQTAEVFKVPTDIFEKTNFCLETFNFGFRWIQLLDVGVGRIDSRVGTAGCDF
jgi:hypothetical protein